MKRFVLVLILIVSAVGIHADEVPIPFFGSLYLFSRNGVDYERTLSQTWETTEFRYPGHLPPRLRTYSGK